jgi:hypothetical protein
VAIPVMRPWKMRAALFLDIEDGNIWCCYILPSSYHSYYNLTYFSEFVKELCSLYALDDKFKFCFLLFLGDSICSHVCWYQILQMIKLLFHIPLLKYPNNGIWYQAGGLNPVSKLVFLKIENNNLLCVVLIKSIVFDRHI